jgi:plastocyanin
MNILKVLAVASLAALAGCGSSSTGPSYGNGNGGGCTPGSGTVCLVAGNKFSPSQITVTAGSNVTFNNTSGTTHNVTFANTAGAPANVDDFASGTKVVAFPTAGTFDYHCTIHGLSMSGVVVVQ